MKPANIARRLHALEHQSALQMARRIMALPPRLVLAALLDVAPEDLPSHLAREDLPEELRPMWDDVAHWTPQEEEAHLAPMLLVTRDDPATQRLLALVGQDGICG